MGEDWRDETLGIKLVWDISLTLGTVPENPGWMIILVYLILSVSLCDRIKNFQSLSKYYIVTVSKYIHPKDGNFKVCQNFLKYALLYTAYPESQLNALYSFTLFMKNFILNCAQHQNLYLNADWQYAKVLCI